MAFWLPLLMVVLGLGKAFADEDGKLPKWLVKLTGMLFTLVWRSYDAFFKKIFGDGERTIGQEEDEDGDGVSARRKWCEKSVRLV